MENYNNIKVKERKINKKESNEPEKDVMIKTKFVEYLINIYKYII